MATIKKRGNGYSVIYSHLNSDGEKKQKWESFSTHAAAKARKITVENDLQEGVFVAPSQLTVSEYLDTFMELYGAKKWALSSYTRNQRIFTNYVIPYMGDVKMQEVTPLSIEKYYHELLYSASKVKNKRSNTATTGVIMQIHKSLKCAFHNAERLEIIKKNPFENVTPPKHISKTSYINLRRDSNSIESLQLSTTYDCHTLGICLFLADWGGTGTKMVRHTY